ncbi:hypothetical protein ACH4FX_18195 [Streptomyces sp. NPDC018019]|uniref:hypothetical protein n=1 Tax=Streptomyces sp. NPDC018019 TaxID=3365030 RepID=UPI0037AFC81E
MRTHIRRSIVVAAAASGLWALGSAAAGAAELPGTADLPAAGAVTDTVRGGLPAGDVHTQDLPAAPKLPAPKLPATDGLGKAAGLGEGTGLSKVTDLTKTAGLGKATGLTKTVDRTKPANLTKLTKTVNPTKATRTAQHAVRSLGAATGGQLPTGLGGLPTGLGDLPAADLPTGEVPGVQPVDLPEAPALPKAPGSAGNLLAGLSGAGVRPEQLTGAAQGALGTARPVVDSTTADVLPPVTQRLVGKVVPVAQGAVGGAGQLAGDVTNRATPFVQRVAGGAQVFVQGVATDATPFAQDLAGTVRTDATGITGSAAAGLQGALPGQAVPTVPADLTDAANIPALPALPALPSLPGAPTLPAQGI